MRQIHTNVVAVCERQKGRVVAMLGGRNICIKRMGIEIAGNVHRHAKRVNIDVSHRAAGHAVAIVSEAVADEVKGVAIGRRRVNARSRRAVNLRVKEIIGQGVFELSSVGHGASVRSISPHVVGGW